MSNNSDNGASASNNYRLPSGGQIDRQRPLRFSFNGQNMQGFHGDTLASALLANGVHLVNRSIKLHRPRGIVAAGPEETNAIVQVGAINDARTLPNQRATQVELYDGLRAYSINGWPSLQFDLMGVLDYLHAFLPAGFYYKTFMWPQRWWMGYERLIRRAAGFGIAPRHPDPDIYDKRFAHCDVLVVGSGPAGIAAARAATQTGARTWLVESQPQVGGSLLYREARIDDQDNATWLQNSLRELQQRPNFTLKTRTTVNAFFDHNFLTLLERVSEHLPLEQRVDKPRQCFWKLRARQVVIAAGAIERPLVFANNDRPGVMLASAVAAYARQYAVMPGRKALIFTNNDSACHLAFDLQRQGVEIAAIVDVRPAGQAGNQIAQNAAQLGIPLLNEHVIIDVLGKKRVRGALVAPLASATNKSDAQLITCDLIASSGGWNPGIHLHSQADGKMRWDEKQLCFVPGSSSHQHCSVGAANGTFELGSALAGGWSAGLQAASKCGCGNVKSRTTPPHSESTTHETSIAELWLCPSPGGADAARKFVDLQNDNSVADIQLAVHEGYSSIEHLKRYTALGFGTDQGKSGNINGMAILAGTLGQPIAKTGTSTFRPPYTPISFGAITGSEREKFLEPVRVTPMHSWHEGAGALFEDVGQWKRAWYYPKSGEDIHVAVARECRATRESVGVLDYSTLGKIDIQGPDSVELLNRVYTNGWNKLAIGRSRYGLMLGEDGMIMDDGVTTRIGENHYLMTTTTGGAARVLAHMERWLQTEWPHLQVYLSTLTDQYSTVAIAGPNSRKLLSTLCNDVALDNDAFPFMSSQNATVGGIEARLTRVSFTGELSFEIMVPASFGLALWQKVIAAGEPYSIVPYGTETMHVLRAEKGFIIVGQDTDGSMTPDDMGMGWIVNMNKGEFIGRRSLARAHCQEAGRKQFVGLLSEDPQTILPEGAQLVGQPNEKIPANMLGHISSSYRSEALQRSIALALVRDGHRRWGETIYVVFKDGRCTAARIVKPVFYDPGGTRQSD